MPNKHYSEAEKKNILDRHTAGKSITALSKEVGISRSTIHKWIREIEEAQAVIPISAREYKLLQSRLERANKIIEILQSVECTVHSPLQVKLAVMEELYEKYEVHVLSDALQVPRGTFYNHIWRNKRDDTWYSKRREELRLKIQEIYDDSKQIFGSRKIAAILKAQGYKVGVNYVRRLMQDMGLVSIRQDAKDLYDKERNSYKNHVKQQFDTTKPNEIWVSDVTYFRMNDINYYICVIIDLFARRVVGCHISYKNSVQLVKRTFKIAYESRKPEAGVIFHSDRGNNYRSETFRKYLKSLNVVQSFSKAYTPYDNSVMESFFASMKKEELYRTKYSSDNEFRKAIEAYIVIYNTQRPHSKNAYRTPEQKELDFYSETAI